MLGSKRAKLRKDIAELMQFQIKSKHSDRTNVLLLSSFRIECLITTLQQRSDIKLAD